MAEQLSRLSATPTEVDAYLRRILAEDVYWGYVQAVGQVAVRDAAHDIYLAAPETAEAAGDMINPVYFADPYPHLRHGTGRGRRAELCPSVLCSQAYRHGGDCDTGYATAPR